MTDDTDSIHDDDDEKKSKPKTPPTGRGRSRSPCGRAAICGDGLERWPVLLAGPCGLRRLAQMQYARQAPLVCLEAIPAHAHAVEVIHEHFRQHPNANLGIFLGPVSGVVRVDSDGPAAEAKLQELSGGDLPETLEFFSGREGGGRGLLYAIPPGVTLKTTPLRPMPGEELRFQAEGAFTVLPPSIHPSGCLYSWVTGRSPDDIAPALMPAWLVELMREQPLRRATTTTYAPRADFDNARVVNRCWRYLEAMPLSVSRNGGHDAMFDACRTIYRGFALDGADAEDLVRRFNAERCEPPWSEKELLHKIEDARKSTLPLGYILERDRDEHEQQNAPETSRVKADQNGTVNGKPQKGPTYFANYTEIETGDDKKIVRVGLSQTAIAKDLLARTTGWPKRVGPLPFVAGADGKPLFLEREAQLFAWIGGTLGGTLNQIRWAKGQGMVPQGQFAAHIGQAAEIESYDAVEIYPHYPPLPGHYYMHDQPRPGGGNAMIELLDRFRPATLIDRDLILSFFLTLAWGGLPGRRPGFLITTAEEDDSQRGGGAGKTTIAKVGGWLFGGMVQAGAADDIDKLKTRLLTPSALGTRIVLLDNLKTFKLSSGELESLITSNMISGHRMYAGEAQRPNTITYVLTINGASLSRDMAQRVIPIVLERREYSGQWEEETRAFVERRRWEIIGDLINVLRTTPATMQRYSRWGSWEAEVLAHVGEPNDCQRIIAERQQQYDQDQAEAGIVADAFRAQLRARGHDPETQCVWIPAAVAAAWTNAATNERRPTNKVSAYLASLSIVELRRSNRADGRGWRWQGQKGTQGAAAMKLGSRPSTALSSDGSDDSDGCFLC